MDKIEFHDWIFHYEENEKGRDFVKDGEHSGIYIEMPKILSVSGGLGFIILQLFV